MKLMRNKSEVENSHQISPTQTQFSSKHYSSIWDSDRQQLSYFRQKDGQQLFVAAKNKQDNWKITQAKNINLSDIKYHQAIAQQQKIKSVSSSKKQPNWQHSNDDLRYQSSLKKTDLER